MIGILYGLFDLCRRLLLIAWPLAVMLLLYFSYGGAGNVSSQIALKFGLSSWISKVTLCVLTYATLVFTAALLLAAVIQSRPSWRRLYLDDPSAKGIRKTNVAILARITNPQLYTDGPTHGD